MQPNTIKKSDLRFFVRLIIVAMRIQKPKDEKEKERIKIVKLTIKETAQRLKKHTSTLWRWRKQPGKLKPKYDGGGEPYYPEHEVNAYLKNQTT